MGERKWRIEVVGKKKIKERRGRRKAKEKKECVDVQLSERRVVSMEEYAQGRVVAEEEGSYKKKGRVRERERATAHISQSVTHKSNTRARAITHPYQH